MAVVLKVCRATVYAMIERGELESVRVSNAIRVVVGHASSERMSNLGYESMLSSSKWLIARSTRFRKARPPGCVSSWSDGNA